MIRMDRKFQNLVIYESRSVLYIVSSHSPDTLHDILEIGRPLLLREDDKVTLHLVKEKVNDNDLSTFMSSRKATLMFKNVQCLFGFVKLSVSYYLVAVTKSLNIANIQGHPIYCVQDVELIPLIYKLRNTVEETRYKNVMLTYSLASGSFYYSYSYNLSQSLQNNTILCKYSAAQQTVLGEVGANIQDRFVWNTYALQPLIAMRDDLSKDSDHAAIIDRLIIPIIHGFVSHQSMSISTMTTVSNAQDGELVDNTSKGSAINFTLIARRSKHFAGTRYLRRGCNNCGDVANEVETEQIITTVNANRLDGQMYRSSSFVQVRGSIPLFWSHTNMFLPSPDIILEDHLAVLESIAKGTPLPFIESTNGRTRAYSPDNSLLVGVSLAHYQNLVDRYGGTVHTVSLIRRAESKREELIGQHFDDVCEELKLYYVVDHCRKGKEGEEQTLSEGTKVIKLTELEAEDHRQKHPSDSMLRPLVNYIAYDMHGKAHDESIDAVFAYLDDLSYELLQNSGFFVSAPDTSSSKGSEVYEEFGTGLTKNLFHPSEGVNGSTCVLVELENGEGIAAFGRGLTVGALQSGVIRTNCIDCLDRTNIGQFAFAKTALYSQLLCLGVKVTPASLSAMQGICMRSWSAHGDVMANQYGGSGAMHKIDDKASTASSSSSTNGTSSPVNSVASSSVKQTSGRSGISAEECREFTLSGGTQNALVAVQRYCSNISTDFERQQCIDVLLGYYEESRKAAILPGQPHSGPGPFVWDLDQHPSRHRKYLPFRRVDLEQTYLAKLHSAFEGAVKGTAVHNQGPGVASDTLVSFDDICNNGSVNNINYSSEQIDFVGCTIVEPWVMVRENSGNSAASSSSSAQQHRDPEEDATVSQFEGYISSSNSASVGPPSTDSRLIERSVNQILPSLPPDLTVSVDAHSTANSTPTRPVGGATGDGLAAAAAKLKQQKSVRASVVDWRYESLPKYSPGRSSTGGQLATSDSAPPSVPTSTSSGGNNYSDVIGTAVVVGEAVAEDTTSTSMASTAEPPPPPPATGTTASIFDFTSKWFFA